VNYPDYICAIALSKAKAIAVLNFNEQDDGDRTKLKNNYCQKLQIIVSEISHF
jgi:hypothetical protein